MPRAARKKSASGIYHVMLRGADRRVLFYDDEDNERFLDTLRHAKEISGFKLYAYCLMGNYVHLLIEEGAEPLELVFKRIGDSQQDEMIASTGTTKKAKEPPPVPQDIFYHTLVSFPTLLL